MNKKITSTTKKSEQLIERLQPKQSTIRTILAFAATYQVQRLPNGDLIQYLLN